jgi:hypothetical protein
VLSQLEAAELLGMSERTFRHWTSRYEAGASLRWRTVDWAGVPLDLIATMDDATSYVYCLRWSRKNTQIEFPRPQVQQEIA